MASRAWTRGTHPCGMLKMSRLLTRPTPAATLPARPESAKTAPSPRDAPFRWQGRSEGRGEAYVSVRWASERSENEAGGLFQHPARKTNRPSATRRTACQACRTMAAPIRDWRWCAPLSYQRSPWAPRSWPPTRPSPGTDDSSQCGPPHLWRGQAPAPYHRQTPY